ncbi:MAG TPA: hypothetical protein VGO71_13760 [Baekduia sp.]|jgi:hypothetical protein|nr:hypothetical protein [Baekduia sp.]
MHDPDLTDLEYRAEFERQQFVLYDARRLAVETHANAVIAVALAIAAVMVSDYARDDHPAIGWFLIGLAGVGWVFVFANIARVVSFPTPRWLGGKRWKPRAPSDVVKDTLNTIRDEPGAGLALRKHAHDHWRARAESAYKLGDLKGRRLRLSLWGLLAPAVYFAARLLS